MYKKLLQKFENRRGKNNLQVINIVTHSYKNQNLEVSECMNLALITCKNSILEAKPPHLTKVVYAPAIGSYVSSLHYLLLHVLSLVLYNSYLLSSFLCTGFNLHSNCLAVDNALVLQSLGHCCVVTNALEHCAFTSVVTLRNSYHHLEFNLTLLVRRHVCT